MAVDIFLKLDGIKGESQDHKHKDEIDVLAWSWGVFPIRLPPMWVAAADPEKPIFRISASPNI